MDSNSVNTVVSSTWGVNWSDETKYLISLWGEDDIQRQLDGCARNKSIWCNLAEKIKAVGYDTTWDHCKTQLKNLKQNDKIVKDANNVSGASRKSYRFFEELDAVLGTRPATRPTVVIDIVNSRPNLPAVDSAITNSISRSSTSLTAEPSTNSITTSGSTNSTSAHANTSSTTSINPTTTNTSSTSINSTMTNSTTTNTSSNSTSTNSTTTNPTTTNTSSTSTTSTTTANRSKKRGKSMAANMSFMMEDFWERQERQEQAFFEREEKRMKMEEKADRQREEREDQKRKEDREHQLMAGFQQRPMSTPTHIPTPFNTQAQTSLMATHPPNSINAPMTMTSHPTVSPMTTLSPSTAMTLDRVHEFYYNDNHH